MDLTFYHLTDDAADLQTARKTRAWMDATHERYAYRCLPLVIANQAGWELLNPAGFTVTWNGGPRQQDMVVTFDEQPKYPFASSHFGYGMLTFHSGYLMKTSEGVSLWVMGSPNEFKDGIQACVGLVETAWLPFPFTMNWKMTRPGRVRFEKGEPFAFMTPSRFSDIEQTVPVEREIEDDPDAHAAFTVWAKSRAAFDAGLKARDPETVKQGWQRNYITGTHPEGTPAPAPSQHHSKLRVKGPQTGGGQ